MEVKSSHDTRRSQADRSAATKGALIAAARELFAEHGFGGVGTEAIVRKAGVTRGAMYHQFADKTGLFEAVLVDVEIDVMNHILATVGASESADPIQAMRVGARAMLDAATGGAAQRIVLIDGPSVLGWQRWREVCLEYAAGMVETMIAAGIDAGRVAPQPTKPLAHVLIGALDEAALYVAQADDPLGARAEMERVIDQLISALDLAPR